MNLYINVCYLHMFDIPCCGRYFCGLSHIYPSGVLFPSDALKHGAVSKLISLNFNVCVVRHCHDKDHKTSQEFTLVWLIIINSAVPLTALHCTAPSKHAPSADMLGWAPYGNAVRSKRIPALRRV